MLRCRVNTDQLHRLAVVVVVGNHIVGLCVGHREERREVGGVDDPALYANRYSEAEALHKRALLITEKALGPDHPDTVEALNNHGLWLFF